MRDRGCVCVFACGHVEGGRPKHEEKVYFLMILQFVVVVEMIPNKLFTSCEYMHTTEIRIQYNMIFM